jgi:hypothetical protein
MSFSLLSTGYCTGSFVFILPPFIEARAPVRVMIFLQSIHVLFPGNVPDVELQQWLQQRPHHLQLEDSPGYLETTHR